MGIVLAHPNACGEDDFPATPPSCAALEELRRRDSERHRYIDIATTGVDERWQGLGGDPFGGLSCLGMRVPFLATPDRDSRYLFMLASFTVGEGARVRVRHIRQLWTLGAKFTSTGSGNTVRVVEQEVLSPSFQPPNANISWHLRIINRNQVPTPRAIGAPGNANVRGIQYRDSDISALLYETATTPNSFYVNLTSYVPPNKGRPWGMALDNSMGTFYDLRAPWQTTGQWLDIPVDGPAKIAFYASVRQQVFTAAPLTVPSPEETFISDVVNFSGEGVNVAGPMIWRVAGGMLLELDR